MRLKLHKTKSLVSTCPDQSFQILLLTLLARIGDGSHLDPMSRLVDVSRLVSPGNNLIKLVTVLLPNWIRYLQVAITSPVALMIRTQYTTLKAKVLYDTTIGHFETTKLYCNLFLMGQPWPLFSFFPTHSLRKKYTYTSVGFELRSTK